MRTDLSTAQAGLHGKEAPSMNKAAWSLEGWAGTGRGRGPSGAEKPLGVHSIWVDDRLGNAQLMERIDQFVGQPGKYWEKFLGILSVPPVIFSPGLSPFWTCRQPLSQITGALMECGRCFRKEEVLGEQPSTAFLPGWTGHMHLSLQLPSPLLPFHLAVLLTWVRLSQPSPTWASPAYMSRSW